MVERFLCLLIGYGFGCVLTAELVSYRLSHESIQEKGSHNPGMTNALRLYGKKAGLIVLAGDLLKTVIACLMCAFLFPLPDHLAVLYAGLGSIIGHDLPFWNGFKGGKGVACTCMAIFCFSPLWGLIACLLGLIACIISQYLAVGGILIPLFFFISMTLKYHSVEISVLCFLIFALMFKKSFASLCKVIDGSEERGLWLKKKA